MEIDGKKYKLEKAYVIPESEVETVWAQEWGDKDTYEVDIARKEIEVKECFVLVERIETDE